MKSRSVIEDRINSERNIMMMKVKGLKEEMTKNRKAQGERVTRLKERLVLLS
jgi:hypothetical protein